MIAVSVAGLKLSSIDAAAYLVELFFLFCPVFFSCSAERFCLASPTLLSVLSQHCWRFRRSNGVEVADFGSRFHGSVRDSQQSSAYLPLKPTRACHSLVPGIMPDLQSPRASRLSSLDRVIQGMPHVVRAIGSVHHRRGHLLSQLDLLQVDKHCLRLSQHSPIPIFNRTLHHCLPSFPLHQPRSNQHYARRRYWLPVRGV